MKIEEPLPSSSDDHNLVKCCRRTTSYMAGSETGKVGISCNNANSEAIRNDYGHYFG